MVKDGSKLVEKHDKPALTDYIRKYKQRGGLTNASMPWEASLGLMTSYDATRMLVVMTSTMKILLIDPYYGTSHRAWAEGIQQHSSHDVSILSLPGSFWKWRMEGGAITLARKFLKLREVPDLILASSMLDLPTFTSLTRKQTALIPTAIYFHENQLSYPWSPEDPDLQKGRNLHYGMINARSALVADRVFFNSMYQQNSFLEELRKILKSLPDPKEMSIVDEIVNKSYTLPVGLDLTSILDLKPQREVIRESLGVTKPLIIWNHRWEYDKNPKDFFEALKEIKARGCEFQLAILGEHFRESPKEFKNAKDTFSDEIVAYGFEKERKKYLAWLIAGDILPVTSNQEFFGLSVIEAIYAGCAPILPRRLSYPELFEREVSPQSFYHNSENLAKHIEQLVARPREESTAFLEQYDWQKLAKKYDSELEKLLYMNSDNS